MILEFLRWLAILYLGGSLVGAALWVYMRLRTKSPLGIRMVLFSMIFWPWLVMMYLQALVEYYVS